MTDPIAHDHDRGLTAVPKPDEFVALGPHLKFMFDELKTFSGLTDTYTFDLEHVDVM